MTNLAITLEHLTAMIVEVVDNPERTAAISASSRLVEDLGMDSITLVALVFLCEERFGLNLSERAADAMGVPTVGHTLAFLQSCRETEGLPA